MVFNGKVLHYASHSPADGGRFWGCACSKTFRQRHSKQFVAHVYVLESFSSVNGNFECRSKYLMKDRWLAAMLFIYLLIIQFYN